MATAVPPSTAPPDRGLAGRRVLVVFESGPAGAAAIDVARELAEQERATVTVVTIAPQVEAGLRCGISPGDYNSAIRDAAARELAQARTRLGDIGRRTAFELLIEGSDPPLQDWSVMGGFDMVLLPARRRPLRSPSHPAAAALKRTGAEVRIIDRRGQQLALA
jgi:nucleotide-binding universal stress UspA family protein